MRTLTTNEKKEINKIDYLFEIVIQSHLHLRISVNSSIERSLPSVNVFGLDVRFSNNRNAYLKKYSQPEYSESDRQFSNHSNSPVNDEKIETSFFVVVVVYTLTN